MKHHDGSTFVLVEETTSWLEAVGNCHVLGGHLAVMDDNDEFNVFNEMLAEYRSGGGTSLWSWIDGTDMMLSGTWFCKYRDGVCPHFEWLPTQPNGGHTVSLCVALSLASQGANDLPCSRNDMVSICEFEAKSCTTA